MLHTEREDLGHGLHAVVVWDDGWKSFNNFYIIDRPGRLTLVDTGKPGHLEALTGSLAALGRRLDGVAYLAATHGHMDHIGSAGHLKKAQRAIHPAERAALPEWQQRLFPVDLPDAGEWAGLQVRRLPPYHSPGSVALYDAQSGALFCGDHLCCFGDPLPQGGIAGACEDLRLQAATYVETWRDRARRNNPYQPDTALHDFLAGLAVLASFEQAQLLCTGHGPVLRGRISEFLQHLVAIGQGRG